MRLITLPFKNAIVSWWRSLTLGIFFMILCFVMVFFQSVIRGAVDGMESAVTDSLTGHLQFRPDSSTEKDMADIQKANWDSLPTFSVEESRKLSGRIKELLPEAEVYQRIRQNFVIISDKDKVATLTIGIDPSENSYKNVYQLISGHYIEKPDEILLTERDALQLKVKVGDVVSVIATTQDGYRVDGAFTVAGIGNLRMLSMFRFTMAFCTREGIASVLGTDSGQATEIIAVLKEPRSTLATEAMVKEKLGAEKVKVSDYRNMGGFMMSVASATGILFYGMLVILMCVMYLLIGNLVFLSCLERYKEIGTFRALGFSRFKVASLFIGEILIVTGGFGGLGIILAIGAILYFGHVGLPAISQSWEYAMGKKMFLTFNVESLIPVILIAGAFILMASLYPSLRAVKARPVESLREE